MLVHMHYLQMLMCRLNQHDAFAELYSGVTDFKEAGGIASVAPSHGGGNKELPLPASVCDGTLHVYHNVKIVNLVVPRRGPGAMFLVILTGSCFIKKILLP